MKENVKQCIFFAVCINFSIYPFYWLNNLQIASSIIGLLSAFGSFYMVYSIICEIIKDKLLGRAFFFRLFFLEPSLHGLKVEWNHYFLYFYKSLSGVDSYRSWIKKAFFLIVQSQMGLL